MNGQVTRNPYPPTQGLGCNQMPVQPERKSELQRVIDDLSIEINILSDSFASLSSRLDSVSRKEPTCDESKDCVEQSFSTQAASNLQRLVRLVKQIRVGVENQTHLLEV